MYSLRLPSEIGEIQDSTRQKIESPTKTIQYICSKCKNAPLTADQNIVTTTETANISSKFCEILQENETLRLGMHEILEKLREYDGKYVVLFLNEYKLISNLCNQNLRIILPLTKIYLLEYCKPYILAAQIPPSICNWKLII